MENTFWKIILFCFILTHPESIISEKVVVKSGDMQTWFQASFSQTGNGSGGEPWSDPGKYALNSSRTCGGSKNNWLFTKYVGLGETFADFVHVNIEAELTLYYSGTRYSRLLQVYVYRGNDSIDILPREEITGFISRYFTPVYTITNTTRPQNVTGRGIVKENQTFPLHLNKTDGVLFVIKSNGACAEIFKIKLYYYYCKEKFINSVKFENTTSPLNGSKEVAGNCSDNSSLSKDLTSLKGFCQSNGTWSVNENVKCLCKEGFEPHTWKGCLLCGEKYFKQNPSNENCTRCPLNSVPNENKTKCRCKDGYYNRPNDLDSRNCYGLIQVNLKLKCESEGTSVNITWHEPERQLTDESLRYDIRCSFCDGKHCNGTCSEEKYHPGQYNITQTFVKISDLKPGGSYVFKVYPKDSLNKKYAKEKWNFTKTVCDIMAPEYKKKDSLVIYTSLYIIIGIIVSFLFTFTIILVAIAILRRLRNFLNQCMISITYAREIDRIEHISMAERNRVAEEENEFPLRALAEGNIVQWRQTSTKHRLKFEELLKIAEKEPSAVTIIGTYRVCFRPEFVIGYGSSGTVVYIGLSDDGIEVAVKSIPMHICKELGENEKEILNCPSVRKESHIVNYRFYTDSVNSWHGYLVLDLHEESLKEYVLERSKEELISDGPRIIREVLCGLKALHYGKEEILHRDLKPENILVSAQGEMVLSDFGISRKLRKGQTTHKSGEKGTDDWIAVESLLADVEDDDDSSNEQAEKQVRYKKQSDIQVTGMLLFYILSKGGHPYGKRVYRKVNLLEGKPVNLGNLDDPVAKDLIGWMLQHDPKNRPRVHHCLQHPYLLTRDEQFNLVTRVGNEREIKTNDITSVVVKELNADPLLPKPSWKPKIDPEVLRYASSHRRHRPYSDSMADLLRFIRNTAEHWHDRTPPSTVEAKVGKPKEYFLKLFPTLPVVLHRIIRNESDWNQREQLNEFFS